MRLSFRRRRRTRDRGPRRLRWLGRHIEDAWPAVVIGPSSVRELMDRYRVGRSVFARMLGTSAQVVWKWQTGRAEPTGPAKRLLELLYTGRAELDPGDFRRRPGRKRRDERGA